MKRDNKLGKGLAIGIGIGVVIGVATDNLGLWISLGVVIGAGLGQYLRKQGKKKDDGDASNKNSQQCTLRIADKNTNDCFFEPKIAAFESNVEVGNRVSCYICNIQFNYNLF